MQLTFGGAPMHAAFGSCYICRHFPADKAWVDTGIDIVGEGTLVICSDHGREIAKLLGFVPASTNTKMKETISTLKQQLAEARPKLAAYEMFLDQLAAARG